MIKKYNVTLDSDVVDRAKKKAEESGGKLSPLLNKLLENWIKEQKEKSQS